MNFFTCIVFCISLLFLFSSCESFQDGPMAVDKEQVNILKPGEILSNGKQVKVCKAIYEGCQIQEIYWDESDFNLPDSKVHTFTITSAEVCLVSSNETTTLYAKMFGKSYTTPVTDCQLPSAISWEGEYPEEHPFYDGFSIHISSSEVLEEVEAVCSITYVLH